MYFLNIFCITNYYNISYINHLLIGYQCYHNTLILYTITITTHKMNLMIKGTKKKNTLKTILTDFLNY